MVYLAELVVMTAGLKIVRIRARTPYTDTSGRRRRVSRVSLSMKVTVLFSTRWGTVLLKHKNHLGTTCTPGSDF